MCVCVCMCTLDTILCISEFYQVFPYLCLSGCLLLCLFLRYQGGGSPNVGESAKLVDDLVYIVLYTTCMCMYTIYMHFGMILLWLTQKIVGEWVVGYYYSAIMRVLLPWHLSFPSALFAVTVIVPFLFDFVCVCVCALE